jgi:hypothetical protein
VIKDNTTNDDRDKVIWTWKRGDTALSDLGDPINTTSYALCVYDASIVGQPRLTATVRQDSDCSIPPCWSGNAKGFHYFDPAKAADGINHLKLKPGTAKTKIILAARGSNLAPLPLPLTGSVIAQLQNSDGECWGATYDSNIKKSDERTFKGRQ